MHIINIEEDRIGLRFGVTQENRLVLLAVTEGKSSRQAAMQETAFEQESAPQAAAMQETAFAQEDGVEAGNEEAFREYAPLEAMITGENCPEDRMGNQLIHTSLAVKLRYEGHERKEWPDGAESIFSLHPGQTAPPAPAHNAEVLRR